MKKERLLFVLFFLVLSFGIISAGQLSVTEEHPFLVNGSWISASQLKVGDVLTTSDGENVTIKKIIDVEQKTKVYNLEAGIYHNFVVGEENVIVHNSNMPSLGQSNKVMGDHIYPNVNKVVFSGKEGNTLAEEDLFLLTNEILTPEQLADLPPIMKRGLVAEAKEAAYRKAILGELPPEVSSSLEGLNCRNSKFGCSRDALNFIKRILSGDPNLPPQEFLNIPEEKIGGGLLNEQIAANIHSDPVLSKGYSQDTLSFEYKRASTVDERMQNIVRFSEAVYSRVGGNEVGTINGLGHMFAFYKSPEGKLYFLDPQTENVYYSLTLLGRGAFPYNYQFNAGETIDFTIHSWKLN